MDDRARRRGGVDRARAACSPIRPRRSGGSAPTRAATPRSAACARSRAAATPRRSRSWSRASARSPRSASASTPPRSGSRASSGPARSRSCCRARPRSRPASRARTARWGCAARRTRLRASSPRAARRAGAGPLTATSCNASGAPAARTRAAARRVCGGDPRVRVISDGARRERATASPSTVVDVTGPRPRVLRWGALAEPALRPVLEELAA